MHLPTELWYRVIGFATDLDDPYRLDFAEHLLPPFSKESLQAKLNISKVSHSFREISLRYLYESITVKSRRSLDALEYTLVHSSIAHRVSLHVAKLTILINSSQVKTLENHDSVCQAVTRILRNTSGLAALQVDLLYSGYNPWSLPPSSMHLIEEMARSVPSSIKRLIWRLKSSCAESAKIIRIAVQSCSRSLRALTFFPYADTSEDRNTEVLDLQSLTHLEILREFSGLHGLLAACWRVPSLAHIRARSLSLVPQDVSFPTVTRLDVKEHMNLGSATNTLQQIFPALNTLSYPSAMHVDLWSMGSEHASLHTLVLDNSRDNELALVRALQEDMQSYTSVRPWRKLREHLGSINTKQLPNLRSMTMRVPDYVVSAHPENRRFIWQSISHLREAGVDLTVEEVVG